ncbi:carboxymuconolactone decarboxylase family protein [Rhodobacteraceae bacterium RKSG542]|uniref:carboxymuconolactone decarboxylase family protein n=1 Tax=Pseudovibrio flavus TaxID=2529854 RepID=UPI0012BD2717|nr:carboxymuconolactone decarboxylase family protein [Pseudovibrio flavus]MTI17838.1 carboxymuconolactone decarboxylase family protein [Pseudovibrio flavus]
MSVTNWHEFIGQTDKRLAELRPELPGVMKGFGEVARSAIAPGVLDSKTKELIALAIGIAARCDGCLGYHSKAALKYGATREEIIETIGVAVYMGGGPSLMYGAEALSAYDEFAKDAETA